MLSLFGRAPNMEEEWLVAGPGWVRTAMILVYGVYSSLLTFQLSMLLLNYSVHASMSLELAQMACTAGERIVTNARSSAQLESLTG